MIGESALHTAPTPAAPGNRIWLCGLLHELVAPTALSALFDPDRRVVHQRRSRRLLRRSWSLSRSPARVHFDTERPATSHESAASWKDGGKAPNGGSRVFYVDLALIEKSSPHCVPSPF